MATNLTPISDLDAFQLFVDQRLGGVLKERSLADAIAEFRQHQSQLATLQSKLRESEKSDRVVMTDEVVKERYQKLDDKLRKEGITN